MAAPSLPTTPTIPAVSSAQRCVGVCGFTKRSITCTRASQGAPEDDCDDAVARPPLASAAAHDERDAERDRGQRVASVVDDIGQQSNTVAQHKDRELEQRGGKEHGQTETDGPDSCSRPDGFWVHEPVGVPVLVAVPVWAFWQC